jgi:hypothetical protein
MEPPPLAASRRSPGLTSARHEERAGVLAPPTTARSRGAPVTGDAARVAVDAAPVPVDATPVSGDDAPASLTS